MNTVYRFKDAAHLRPGLDPQAIGERLERLRALDGPGLTSERVVEDARDPNAPHHEHFTWDDSEAAHKHRLAEAGYLVRERAGRRNRYAVGTTLTLRHPLEAHCAVSDLLRLLVRRKRAAPER